MAWVFRGIPQGIGEVRGGETNIRSQLRELVNNQYSRNDTEIARGRFRRRRCAGDRPRL